MIKKEYMNNKNGFTLIELLMVIGMIALLLVIFIPTLLGVSDDVKNDTYLNKLALIETAAENFIEDKKNYIKGGNDLCIDVKYLIENGYLTSEGNDGSYMINPIDNTQMDGSIKLEYTVVNGVGKAKATYMADTMCEIAFVDDISSDRYETGESIAPSKNSLIIADGASQTGSLNVKLTITNESNTATGMCIKNELNNGSLDVNDNCDSFMWKSYTNIYNNWELLDDDNLTKNVYVWLRNSNRIATIEPVTDDIEFVVGVPRITFEPENNATYENNVNVKFTVTSSVNLTDIRYSWIKSTEQVPQYLGNVTNINPNSQKYEEIVAGNQSGIYKLCVSARNESDFETTICSDNFYLDVTGPIITIEENNNIQSTHTPTITAIDNDAGIENIKYLWSTTNNASAKNGTLITSGEKAESPIEVLDNGTMYLCVYAVDKANNESNTCSSFIFDEGSPIITVSPSSSDFINKLNVTINVEDPNLYSKNVYKYYLSSSENSLTGGSLKTYTRGKSFSIGTNLNGTYYLFVTQVRDVEGNLSSINNVTINSVTYHRFGPYIFDNTKPTVTITTTSKPASTAEKSKNITINANDINLSGDNSYQYYISTKNNAFIDGEWINYISGEEFTIGTGLTGNYYLFVKQISDLAGNVSTNNSATISKVLYHRFGPYKFDNEPPTVNSFTINSGATMTTSNQVTLNSSVNGSPKEMCFSNTYSESCNGTWITYKPKYTYWYINKEPTSYVYAWYRDALGNTTSSVFDTIEYRDPIYPWGSITINNGASSTTRRSVTVQIESQDATGMCISNSRYCTTYVAISDSKTINIAGNEYENNYIYIQFVSETGNVFQASDYIYYNPPLQPPEITTNLVDGGWYAAGTDVIVTCKSSGTKIINFDAKDDSSRFGAHPLDDHGTLKRDSIYVHHRTIDMASASSDKCWRSCTYRIDASCENSAGITTASFYFQLGLTDSY